MAGHWSDSAGLPLLVVWCFGAICLAQMSGRGSVRGDQEYCEGEAFIASCGSDEAIVIESALYGRMKSGKCITGEYGAETMGCASDARLMLDKACSGRQSCEVDVTSLVRMDGNTCPKQLRSYLEASYSCVKVIPAMKRECEGGTSKKLTHPKGFISSYVTEETGCGTIDAPWLVEVSPGQQLNFTLWDFGLMNNRHKAGPPVCHVYAILKDTVGTSSLTICGETGKRTQQVYKSQANVVEIRIVSKKGQLDERDSSYFLLYYEAIGCPNLEAPKGGYFKRNGNSATIGCHATEEFWEVTCHQGTWLGSRGNCSELDVQTGKSTFWVVLSSSQGLSIAIIVGVAILVGLVILVIGLFCLRWKRDQHVQRMEEYSSGTYGRGPGYAVSAGSYIPPEGVSIGDKPRDMDPYGGGENNYYRTWQLQNHASKVNAKNSKMSSPPYNRSMSSGENRSPRYPAEHVYESPKFERRELPGGSVDNTHAQYFELDPDVMRGQQVQNPSKVGGSLRMGQSTNASEPDMSWRQNEERMERGMSTR